MPRVCLRLMRTKRIKTGRRMQMKVTRHLFTKARKRIRKINRINPRKMRRKRSKNKSEMSPMGKKKMISKIRT